MLSGKDASHHCFPRGSQSEDPLSGSPFLLFDAHCHLQDERLWDIVDSALERARKKNVISMMCCGCQENDWDKVRDLSAKDGVTVSFGLHPWYVMERSPKWFDTLRKFLDSFPSAGVGEIGLDNAISDTDGLVQEEVFVRQLCLARELARPVSIHCRGAFGRMMELLEKEGGVGQCGLIHSYSGSAELVPRLEQLGLSLSFSGAITRPKNKRARAVVSAVSPDRLLIETDSPDMPPESAPTGAVNEPAYLPIVLETVAKLIGLSEENTAKLTRDNAQRLFLKDFHEATS
jgi:TatD DNase family protein